MKVKTILLSTALMSSLAAGSAFASLAKFEFHASNTAFPANPALNVDMKIVDADNPSHVLKDDTSSMPSGSDHGEGIGAPFLKLFQTGGVKKVQPLLIVNDEPCPIVGGTTNYSIADILSAPGQVNTYVNIATNGTSHSCAFAHN